MECVWCVWLLRCVVRGEVCGVCALCEWVVRTSGVGSPVHFMSLRENHGENAMSHVAHRITDHGDVCGDSAYAPP